MKKKFIVEIDYTEKTPDEGHVLYDVGIEVTLDSMMEGYIETNSIGKDYSVSVEEVK